MKERRQFNLNSTIPVLLAAALSVIGSFVLQLLNQVDEIRASQDKRHQYIAQLQRVDEEVDLLRSRVREIEQGEVGGCD